jgi:oligosaccharide repeat unit polymerase
VVFSYRRIFKKINPSKILFTALIALSVLLYSFAWLGTFTKTVDEADFLNPVCIYVGSSIIALDDWFQRDKVFSANQFGEGSFHGLYMLANFFQGDLIKNASSESNFIRKGTFSTNIYTGFCSYLNEYGWPGLFIICVMLGLIFQYGYQYVVNNPKPLYVMIYGYFFIDFLYLLFAPSITSNLFTPTSIMGLVWIVIIFKFLARTKELNG